MRGWDTLVVFARYPTPGRVKTRLAARLGDQGAAQLYEAFVRDLVARFSDARFAIRFAVAPPDPGFARRFGLPASACFEQRGADLGMRMEDAIRSSLGGGARRCVLVGSDMPHLSQGSVEEAFARLDSADVVLGPTLDGGYYLIGMTEPRNLFAGMTWSVDSVLVETKRRAARQGLSIAELSMDFDVDEAEDLERLRRRLARDGPECRETARVLGEVAPG